MKRIILIFLSLLVVGCSQEKEIVVPSIDKFITGIATRLEAAAFAPDEMVYNMGDIADCMYMRFIFEKLKFQLWTSG